MRVIIVPALSLALNVAFAYYYQPLTTAITAWLNGLPFLWFVIVFLPVILASICFPFYVLLVLEIKLLAKSDSIIVENLFKGSNYAASFTILIICVRHLSMFSLLLNACCFIAISLVARESYKEEKLQKVKAALESK